MARRKSRTLTEVELEFMQILWSEGRVTPEDIQNSLLKKGRSLTGGSIRKVLSILIKKGYVDRSRKGKGHEYYARVTREQANSLVMHDVLNRIFHGSASLMVAALLDTSAVPEEDMEEIKNLIAERKKESQK